jgi:hypothetical protein
MKYSGSCHCQSVMFEIETESAISEVTECNCSICSRKGILHYRVNPSKFKLLTSDEHLTIYQFGTKEAKHYFCKHCGIHTFTNPRAAPDLYTVNVRCLEGVDLSKLKINYFDGLNWEKNAYLLKR